MEATCPKNLSPERVGGGEMRSGLMFFWIARAGGKRFAIRYAEHMAKPIGSQGSEKMIHFNFIIFQRLELLMDC
jgi:hypothetical protein